MSLDALKRKVEQLKAEGFLISGRVGVKMSRFRPVKLRPGKTTTEMIREMRDESY
jgi:hypothetical protein